MFQESIIFQQARYYCKKGTFRLFKKKKKDFLQIIVTSKLL